MSFQRRIFLSLTLVLALLLAANLVLSVMNSRNYFAVQLGSVTRDAATSLGFSISQAARLKDQAQIDSMMDVIFDSGDYLSVTYVDLDGNIVASRARKEHSEDVPKWFQSLVNIPLASGVAEVQSGWMQLGQVRVVAHPAHAYRELWQDTVAAFWLFLFSLVLAYGLVGVCIRYFSRPLNLLEKYADAISREEFDLAAPENDCRELKPVFSALERMVKKLRHVMHHQLVTIERLRKETFLDALTGLPNRKEFDAQVAAWLESERGEGPSALVLISMPALMKLNDSHGRPFVDRLIHAVVESCAREQSKLGGAVLGRRSGTDIGLFIPGVYPQDLKPLLHKMCHDLNNLPALVSLGEQVVFLGASFSERTRSIDSFLVRADESLRENTRLGHQPTFLDLGDDETAHLSARDWLPVLKRVIATSDIGMYLQPVFTIGNNGDRQIDHYEALSRIRNDGALISAGVFWPLVERFGLTLSADKLVLNRVVHMLEEDAELKVAVNVSPSSLASVEFRAWLETWLSKCHPSVRARLILEMPESVLRYYRSTFSPVRDLLKRTGVAINIDQFGFNAQAIAYLRDANVHCLKLDRRFTLDVHQHKENRFYIHTLIGACQSCDLPMYAEGIQQQEDLDLLIEMGAAGIQGYLLGKPAPYPIP